MGLPGLQTPSTTQTPNREHSQGLQWGKKLQHPKTRKGQKREGMFRGTEQCVPVVTKE